jgi:hypothetical protein
LGAQPSHAWPQAVTDDEVALQLIRDGAEAAIQSALMRHYDSYELRNEAVRALSVLQTAAVVQNTMVQKSKGRRLYCVQWVVTVISDCDRDRDRDHDHDCDRDRDRDRLN